MKKRLQKIIKLKCFYTNVLFDNFLFAKQISNSLRR